MDSRLAFLVAFVMASAVPYIMADGNTTALTYNLTRSECKQTKLCVEKPTSCDPSGSSECFFTSTKINFTDNSLGFELSGNSTGYIAMAAGVSSNVQQGRNIVFVCGNNNGSFFFQTARFTNTSTLATTTSVSVRNIQYNLNVQTGLIQCAFNILINSSDTNMTDTLSILGINTTTFNISNLSNTSLSAFLEVYQGTINGSDLGQPRSSFGGSYSVNLANVSSSSFTNPATATTPTTSKPSSGSTLVISHAVLGLLAAVALRFF